jgi:diguanylate cyclase (GGDEF)-like protein/PAS domain S-box-containing protein
VSLLSCSEDFYLHSGRFQLIDLLAPLHRAVQLLTEAAARMADLGEWLEEVLGDDTRAARHSERARGTAELELLARAVEGLLVLDESSSIVFVSPALRRLLGYPEGLVGRPALELVHPEDAPVARSAMGSVMARPDGATNLEFRAEHADGSWCWLEGRATNFIADPAVRGIVIHLRDSSERKAEEDDLRHQALHDTLTGLPNRTLLIDRLHGAIGRSGRDGRSVSVFFLDLDAFKEINDGLGHNAGDEVLAGVAGRLAAVARNQDTVARFGGDEFVVVVEHDQDSAWIQAFADRLRAVFQEPIRADRRLVPVTVSFGIATASGGTPSPRALLRDADAAMYRAKQSGGDSFVMFDESMVDNNVVDLTEHESLTRP